jgi:hypothetical protein
MMSQKQKYVVWAVVCVLVIAAVAVAWCYRGQKQALFLSGDLGVRNLPPNVSADVFDFNPGGVSKKMIFSRYLKQGSSTTGSFAYFTPASPGTVRSGYESFFRVSPWSLQSDASSGSGWRLTAGNPATRTVITVSVNPSGAGDPVGTIVSVAAVPTAK